MDKIIPLAVLAFLATGMNILSAAEFFIAVAGSDANPGTFEKPFATIQRAQDSAAPGDTVYIRGGSYIIPENQIAKKERIFAYSTHLTKSGSPGKRINYWAYKNERPVFDFSAVKPADLRVHAFQVHASWIHIKGLEVIGVQVTIKTHTQSICFANDGSHNIYERLDMHDGQAIGIYSIKGGDNLFLNCDAWRNHDYVSEDGKGGNTDGFGCHPTKGSTGNVFRGCRAWFNSDDGYDCINAHEAVTFENCWAYANGYSPKFEKLGDGNGFKIGGFASTPQNRLPNPIPRHTVINCVSVNNKASGFYANHHPGGSDWIHNSAYHNGSNFNMLGRTPGTFTDIDGVGHFLLNNLSYKGREITRLNVAGSNAAINSFTLGLKLSDKDFLSVNEKELLAPRQANGDLPIIQFLHPAPGSPVNDRGVKVQVPLLETPTYLGAFAR